MIDIRSATGADTDWIVDVTADFGGPVIVAAGKFRDLRLLPARIAMVDGKRAGVLVHRVGDREIEALALRSLVPRKGIGSALMNDVIELARRTNCKRVYLSTTNDNTPARNLHESVGFVLCNRDVGGFSKVLRLLGHDPETVHMIGYNEQPITDVLTYEFRL